MTARIAALARCVTRPHALRNLATCFLGAAMVAALATYGRVDGCGGVPPPPVCGRLTTLVKAGPAIFPVAPGGGVVMFPVLVNVVAFGGGCPAPLTTAITLAVGCFPPPGAAGGIVIPTPVPGFYPVLVPVFIPPGPPRICIVAGSATTTWADGVTTTGLGDTEFCVVEPSPTNPAIPRLDMQLLTPPIQSAQPGDQRVHLYSFTNNDPSESVTIDLNADSEQTSRLGTGTGFAPGSGQGVFSVSDPGIGDNFPIGWLDELGLDGCLPLPPNPMSFAVPHITKTLTLQPGETHVVGVVQRSWCMCSCGSCCESRIKVTGEYSDGTPALACAGAGLLVDCNVPPDFDCANGGSAGHLVAALPWQLNVNIQNPAFPPTTELVRIQSAQVNSGQLLIGTAQASTNWDGFRGRMESKHQPPAGPAAMVNQIVQVNATLDVSSQTPGVISNFVNATLDFAPPTVPNDFFFLNIYHKLSGPAIPPTIDSFFDVFQTVSLDGISSGLHRRALLVPGSFSFAPLGPTTYSVGFAAKFPPIPGFPSVIDRIDLHVDVGSNNFGVLVDGPVCAPSGHDCLVVGPPGCSDADCCTYVCVIDPVCCDATWDSDCVTEADQVCYSDLAVNDECEGAIEIGSGTTAFSTFGATTSPVPLPRSCNEGSGLSFVDDLWYYYQSNCSGVVTVSTCDAADYDTRLAVYDSCQTDGSGLLACNDDSLGCGGFTSKLSFPAICGNKYLIRIGGFNGHGTGTLSISCDGECPSACPTDLNGDGFTDAADLAMLLGAWNTPAFDLTGDGTTNGADLAVLLGGWGPCFAGASYHYTYLPLTHFLDYGVVGANANRTFTVTSTQLGSVELIDGSPDFTTNRNGAGSAGSHVKCTKAGPGSVAVKIVKDGKEVLDEKICFTCAAAGAAPVETPCPGP